MTSVFLSYAQGDDEPFVKRLYDALRARGFDVWWDRVSMPSRLLTFHQEIQDAVAAGCAPVRKGGHAGQASSSSRSISTRAISQPAFATSRTAASATVTGTEGRAAVCAAWELVWRQKMMAAAKDANPAVRDAAAAALKQVRQS